MRRVQTLVVRGTLPTLNEIIAEQGVRFRSGNKRVSTYSEIKGRWMQMVGYEVHTQHIVPVERYPVECRFRYVVQNRRTDPDNISSGARKVILDGLVGCGILKGDGWQYVIGEEGGWTEVFEVDSKNPCVVVTLVERVG